MAKKVLLIGWDAADWKAIHPLMDAGRMPHLQRLVERGAMGRIRYRIVLLERDFGEIVESQSRMVERRGETLHQSPGRRERMLAEYARVMNQTRRSLSDRDDIELFELNYREVLGDPAATAKAMTAFAGVALDTARMAGAVDRSLYRNVNRGS